MGGFETKEQDQQNFGWTRQSQDAASQAVRDESQSSWNTAQNQSIQNAMNQAVNNAWNQTTIAGQQSPFLQQLWGQGAALAGSDPGIAGQARNAWGQALSGGINPGVAEVIANASADMGLNFNRNTLPGIRQGAVGTGGLGGSRQGIAEGLAAGELARNQSNMATTLYTQALDQASRERTAALSMSGAMQGLPWQGLESFARVVGAPAMESYGGSQGSAFGGSSGSAYGSSAGASQGVSRAVSGSTSGGWSDAYNTGTASADEFGMRVLSKK